MSWMMWRHRAGATLGSGVRWGLRQPVDRDAADRKRVQDKFSAPGADEDAARLSREVEGLRRRCGALLEQALEGSEHGDVLFRFEDGRCPFTGHRAVLCAASEEYAGMFRSGMVEGQEGIIGVPPGVSEAGYRGLLEWLYLGESALSPLFCFHVIVCWLDVEKREGARAHVGLTY